MLTVLKKIDVYAKNIIDHNTDKETDQAIFNLLLQFK